jgi:hypothetical protein
MLRLALLVLVLAVPAAADDAYVPLFDGRTTEGWTPVGGQPGSWTVDDGRLVTKGQGGGLAQHREDLRRFHPVAGSTAWRRAATPGSSSAPPGGGTRSYSGLEIQILDDDAAMYKDLKPSQYTGSIYGVAAAERGHTQPPDHWNLMEITAVGPKVTVKLNGATVVDADLGDHADAAQAHPGLKRAEGYIGLQTHSDRVEFRRLLIKERKAK